MSYHNYPLHVPWQMQCWNMQNDIMHRFLNQHVAMIDMLFFQYYQNNEVEMDADMKSHPVSNGDMQENHYEKETDIKKDCESSKKINPERPACNDEWISSGKFFKKVKKKDNEKNNSKPVAKNGANMHQVLDDYEELAQMMQLKEDNQDNVSSRIRLHQITSEKNDLEEKCEVEAMTVDALQEHLTSLELDYQHIVKETDEKIQCLKIEKHNVHKKLHSAMKASEVDKLEISNLKKKNLYLKSNHQCEIDNLQEEIDFQQKEIESQKKEFQEIEKERKKELQNIENACKERIKRCEDLFQKLTFCLEMT